MFQHQYFYDLEYHQQPKQFIKYYLKTRQVLQSHFLSSSWASPACCCSLFNTLTSKVPEHGLEHYLELVGVGAHTLHVPSTGSIRDFSEFLKVTEIGSTAALTRSQCVRIPSCVVVNTERGRRAGDSHNFTNRNQGSDRENPALKALRILRTQLGRTGRHRHRQAIMKRLLPVQYSLSGTSIGGTANAHESAGDPVALQN